MLKINTNYQTIAKSYLFSMIGEKVKAWQEKNPDKNLIKMGIGDAVLPLPKVSINAMHKAVDELGDVGTFRGYGPEQGYEFLRQAIVDTKYKNLGIDASDIFVSDGSKCDSGNIQELFSLDAKIAIPDPVYPVYVDSNVLSGRGGVPDEKGVYPNFTYMAGNAENKFIPNVAKGADVIYICSPNNPTGSVYNAEQLETAVKQAKKDGAIILFDAAYESYIRDDSLPKSIFEIPGAKDVAIEMRSLSKEGGFTGVRCAYMVIPNEVKGMGLNEEMVSLKGMWNRRHSTKFNGVSYPIQRAAEAVFSPEGQIQSKHTIDIYMSNAKTIKQGLESMGFTTFGGVNAPYVWAKTPSGIGSWDMFDKILEEANVVITPGAGFGRQGEGYFRVSAFNEPEKNTEGMSRLEKITF